MTKIERWKPEIGDSYYFIDSCIDVDYERHDGHSWDEERFAAGNCFKTQAEAEAAAEKVKALLLSLPDNGNNLESNLPDKQLPDWCKPGEWVFIDPENVFGHTGYKKIQVIDGLGLVFADGSCIYFSDKIKQARLRPYNAEEMKALVGKPITMLDGAVCLCTVYSKRDESVILESIHWDAQELLRSGYTIDNKPCGVFEHLEDGEWVE